MARKKTISFIGYTAHDNHQNLLMSGIIAGSKEYNLNIMRLAVESTQLSKRLENKLNNQLDCLIDIHSQMTVDGLIFIGWAAEIQNSLSRLFESVQADRKIPLLSLGKIIDGIPSTYMHGDDHVRELLEHLHDIHGLRKIAFVKPVTRDERYGEYERFMKSHGLFNPILAISREDIGLDTGWDFMRRADRICEILFDERGVDVDAIMSMYTFEAVYLLEKLKGRGYYVPDDIVVTSWEDGTEGRYATPPLTSVYYPFYEQGFEGCRIMSEILDGVPTKDKYLIPGQIRIRRSCGCQQGIRIETKHCVCKKPLENKFDLKVKAKIKDELDLSIKMIHSDMIIDILWDEIIGNKQGFVLWFEKYLYYHKFTLDEINVIQTEIVLIRGVVKCCIPGEQEIISKLDYTWHRCGVLIKGKIEALARLQAYDLNIKLEQFREVSQNIITTIDKRKFYHAVEEALRWLQVPNCYIFCKSRYSDNMESTEERLFFSYKNCEITRVAESDEFIEKNGIMEFLYGEERHLYRLDLLHVGDQVIGYIIFEPTIEDDHLYTSFAYQVSNAILGILMFNDIKASNKKLVRAHNDIKNYAEAMKEKTLELDESNKKLSQLDKLKNDFIANITHDFRSPLMIIMSLADFGKKYDDISDRELAIKRYNAITNATLKLKDTIDRLLDLAKMDLRGVKLRIESIDIGDFIKSLVEYYKSVIHTSSITIKCHLPSDPISEIFSDVDKLEEIMHNMISNAMKFVDQHTGKIDISVEDSASVVKISVRDNGIGIPPDKLQYIFGRFDQIEGGRNSRFKGTGIGLAFVQQLLEFLHGTICAESDGEGKGSCFIISLPKGSDVFRDDKIEISIRDDYARNSRKVHYKNMLVAELEERMDDDRICVSFHNRNGDNEYDPMKGVILIVEDNPYIRDIIKEYIIRAGYQNFITTTNGRDGINAVYQFSPDIVICDYNMPQMRGDELHDIMAANPIYKHTPIVFLTAILDREHMLERKRKGAVEYLGKPIDEQELVIVVNQHISKFMTFKKLQFNATYDELTGMVNKQTIVRYVEEQIMNRNFRNLSIIFLDIDYFKKINDRYGHLVGDKVLAAVGNSINEVVRKNDKSGRYGGEEFLVVLPGADLISAKLVAEKIQKKIRDIEFDHDDKKVHITASFGISSLNDHSEKILEKLGISSYDVLYDIHELEKADWRMIELQKLSIASYLIEIADNGLYRAKSTTCLKCGYKAVQREEFVKNACPKCGCHEIEEGRDRIIAL
jgi:diguanylate cyclase (GGDEF)-like protein